MISEKNSVLTCDSKMFVKNTLTDQNLSFLFKNMKYSAAYFHMITCGIFFGTLRRSKDVIFREKKIFTKFCLICLESDLFNV